MATERVLGVFASEDAAAAARARLLGEGVPAGAIEMSASFIADGIAGEAPGQSFENQPGQPPPDSARAREAELVRTGTCTLSVAPGEHDAERIAALLRASGARATLT